MEKAIDLREDTGEMPPGTVHHEQGAVTTGDWVDVLPFEGLV